jgi:membrane associated rhomboid family serine protease
MFNRLVPSEIRWFVLLIWLIFLLDSVLLGVSLTHFGIQPRQLSGLVGIGLSPFLHAGWYHIVSNTIALVVLGSLLNASIGAYQGRLRRIMVLGAMGSGIGVWLFAANGLIVGASGIIFAFLGYLLAHAYFYPSFRSVLVALASYLAYGGALFSLVSFLPHISWAAHFWGLVMGIGLAYLMGRQRVDTIL